MYLLTRQKNQHRVFADATDVQKNINCRAENLQLNRTLTIKLKESEIRLNQCTALSSL